jgi:hypothetical protein
MSGYFQVIYSNIPGVELYATLVVEIEDGNGILGIRQRKESYAEYVKFRKGDIRIFLVASRLEFDDFEFTGVATDYCELARWMHEYVIEKLCGPRSAFK